MLAALVLALAATGTGVGLYLARSGRAGHASTPPTTPPPTPADAKGGSQTPPASPVWRVAWAKPTAWGYGVASNATVRDLATVAIGGSAIRLQISNQFGTGPLDLGAVTVGQQSTAGSVVAGTLHTVTFQGAPTVTIPTGGDVTSDSVTMAVTPGEHLSVSLYIANSDLMSVHSCCEGEIAAYFTANGAGNQTAALDGTVWVASSPWEKVLDAVDVLQSSGRGSIVVVGDSITDGYNATGFNWTDVLQQRIDTLPPAERRAVVNEGISGNTLIALPNSYAKDGGGPPGLSRMQIDALGQPGVSEIVLFLGTNDLYFGASAQQVIAGLEQAITMVHHAGLRIIGVTLLPRQTGVERWSPAQQQSLQQVNNWILTSGAFDGVLNFATVAADVYNGACTPTSMFPPYDSGDHLHPNAAGATALGDSVDTTTLDLPATPQVPPVVSVAATAGCTGVLGIPAPQQSSTTTTRGANGSSTTASRASSSTSAARG